MNVLQGKIKGFASYTPAQIEQMKKDLGFSMPALLLKSCAAYYGGLKRDPYIDEMRMLDALYLRLSATPGATAIQSLFTNDSYVAETYADAMQKRRQLRPNAKTPISVAELATLSTLAITAGGKQMPQRKACLSLTASEGQNETENRIRFAGAGKSLELFPGKVGTSAQKAGDLIILLTPAAGKDRRLFDGAVDELLRETAATVAISSLRRVGAEGLLYALLTGYRGVLIDLCRLSETAECPSLSVVNDKTDVGVLLCVPKECGKIFTDAAKEKALRCYPFALAQEQAGVFFYAGQTHLFDLNPDFLRSLFSSDAVEVRLNDENGTGLFPISRIGNTSAACRYLQAKNPADADIRELPDTGFVSGAASQPENGYFRNAVYTALVPVLSLALAGVPYSAQTLAFSVNFPQSTEKNAQNAATVSTLLGLYRLSAELGIPVACADCGVSASMRFPSLAVYSYASDAKPTKPKFDATNHSVYFCAIETTVEGIPLFVSLRRFLSDVTAQASEGHLIGARIVYRESVTDALREMENDGLYCRLTDLSVASATGVALGVLFEVDGQLPFGKQIGTVDTREQPENYAESSATPLPELPEESLFADTGSVVLFASASDRDAATLADAIRAHTESLLVCSPEDLPGNLALALLTARLLIVCGKTELPASAQIDFALDTLERSGGRAWVFSNTVPERLSARLSRVDLLPEAIPAEVLNLL